MSRKPGFKLTEEHKRKIGIANEPTLFKAGHIPWNKGKKFYEVYGEKNTNWKGNRVGYRGLHTWVIRHLGKPKECEFCGQKQTKTGRKVHWANIDHKYKRNLKDWLELCAKCHKQYDKHK